MDKKYCFLATASNDGVKVCNPSNLKVFRHFKFDYPMACCTFSPNLFSEKHK